MFGINGPISASPHNYIWMRTATLDFYCRRARRGRRGRAVRGRAARPRARRDRARRRRARAGRRRLRVHRGPGVVKDGALLFSSPNTNAIYRWSPGEALTVFRSKSGYTGTDIGRFHQPGSNGLTFDPGRAADDLPARQPPCDPGQPARRHHRARRLLRGQAAQQPQRPRLPLRRHAVLHRSAVRAAGRVRRPGQGAAVQRRVLACPRRARCSSQRRSWRGPNGLAFSPDERYLYVGNWDLERKVVMRYDGRRRTATLSSGPSSAT